MIKSLNGVRILQFLISATPSATSEHIALVFPCGALSIELLSVEHCEDISGS